MPGCCGARGEGSSSFSPPITSWPGHASAPYFRSLPGTCKSQSPPQAAANTACICKTRSMAGSVGERDSKAKQQQLRSARSPGLPLVLQRLPALLAPAAAQLRHPARCAFPQSGCWFCLQGILVTSELAAKITTLLFQQRWKCYSRILKTKQNKWTVLMKQLGGGRRERND